MKYFTPDMLERYGSADDADADQAQAAWEIASEDYSRQYKSIERSLPSRFRSVLDRFYLHDARLFGASVEAPYLFLTMQLDAPPHEVLVVQYHLLKKPVILHSARVSDPCPFFEWLYDEVDVKEVDSIVFF
jgi:hypothetical protein